MLRIQNHFFSSATKLRSVLALMVVVGAGGAALGHAGHHPPRAIKPTPEELAKVLAWADAFDAAHPRKSANTMQEKPHAH